MIEVVISGLEQIQAMVDVSAFERALDRGIERAAEAIRDDTKRLPPVSAARTGYGTKGIPVDTGHMRQMVQKRKVALMAAEIYVGTNYAGYVHQGTGRMPARPFLEWQLNDFGGKEKIATIVSEHLSRLF